MFMIFCSSRSDESFIDLVVIDNVRFFSHNRECDRFISLEIIPNNTRLARTVYIRFQINQAESRGKQLQQLAENTSATPPPTKHELPKPQEQALLHQHQVSAKPKGISRDRSGLKTNCSRAGVARRVFISRLPTTGSVYSRERFCSSLFFQRLVRFRAQAFFKHGHTMRTADCI